MNQEEMNNAQAQELLNTFRTLEQITDLPNASLSGWIDPLEVMIALKQIEQAVKESIDKVKDQAIDAAEMRGEKEFQMRGAKVAVRNSGAGWDYSNVEQIAELKERTKSYEKLAQNAASEAKFGNKVYDSEGVEIAPAERKEGKTNIFITLDKN